MTGAVANKLRRCMQNPAGVFSRKAAKPQREPILMCWDKRLANKTFFFSAETPRFTYVVNFKKTPLRLCAFA